MTRVTVFQYRQADRTTGWVIISLCKMTADSIAAIGAEVIADTEETVLETGLDSDGKYYPGG